MSPQSLCKTPVGLVSTNVNHSEGRTHSRSPQHNSRQGVARQTGLLQLAPEPKILSDANVGSGSMYNQPFCKQNQSPASQILQLQARPRSGGNRCPNTTMGRGDRVCLSPIQPHSQMPTENNPRGCNSNSSMPSLATQPWYAQLLQLVVATPILLPTTTGLLIGPQGQEHPLVNNKTLLLASWRVSGKTFLQKAYQDKLQTLSSLPRELQLRISTSHAGQSGWAGVINNKLIPFNQVLQRL